ncbi:MAG: hypothetical protein IT373_10245 [Polyangiaceae bacterium]|nr:hypothetical protein [Polyangiaceae bacterium]
MRAIQPVTDEPGVLVVGSEVPNLLEPGAASTLVVSQHVDIGIPVSSHGRVKALLARLEGFRPSPEEPSVWLPEQEELIEVNFLGLDRALSDPTESYVLEDSELPLLVFGALSLLEHGRTVEVEGVRIPLPHTADLLLEKLVTERSGVKGDRDLLVVLGLLLVAGPTDLERLERRYRELRLDLRHAARTNLAVLSLLPPIPEMPDPEAHRARVVALLRRLEALERAP